MVGMRVMRGESEDKVGLRWERHTRYEMSLVKLFFFFTFVRNLFPEVVSLRKLTMRKL